MDWSIAPRLRVDLVCFAGLNLSGERRIVDVHPVGGRQGKDFGPDDLKSAVLLGAVGCRVIFKTWVGDGWEDHPWRAVVVTAKHHYRTKDGEVGVRIPDLDWLDAPDARRTDPDMQESFPHAETLAAGQASGDWTYGRSGAIKGRVKAISLDRV